MCGIVGIVGFGDADAAHIGVRRATAALRHRGPDAEGFYFADGIALGHRRLSVLDTASRANQPMHSPDGKSVIIFNGEIYNFPELKRELESQGERFGTTSDTEVLLRLIEREGPSCLPRLRGIFAFAVWNREKRELLLARDPFGEKPLYLARRGGTLDFASELRALLELPDVERRLDYQALGYFLECGLVPWPGTMFNDIAVLEPGHWMRWREGQIETHRYFELDYRVDRDLDALPDAAEAVRSALRVAVRRQMISDVPVGAFLSGGIDSSSIVALMQESSSRPVLTFNVRFEDTGYDESPVARRVAQHLGTEHHELTVTNQGFTEADFWRILDHVGMPFHDSSAIPTYVVSRYARQLVTVALSGDGGDELFAGYTTFQWGQTVNRIARLPTWVTRTGAAAAQAAGRLPGLAAAGRLRQARKAFDAASIPGDIPRFRAIQRLFSQEDVARLLKPDAALRAERRRVNRLEQAPPRADRWTSLRRMMFNRIEHELSSDMLVKVDRMSMANSLEVRAPMLDPDLAALSARLPDRHLRNGTLGKLVLREAMRPFLPAEVFSHRKWGFSIPLHRFINDQFRQIASRLLAPEGPMRDLIDSRAAAQVLHRGLVRVSDAADFSVYQATHQLWSLMQLGGWLERYKVSLA
jgi:asparagine synthase (glutamine-hydrolysing)